MCTLQGLWLEGIQLRPEKNNEINVLPIRLCFINIYSYPNPKLTPYRNEKIVIIVVQSDKKQTVLMCACPVAPYISLLALIHVRPPQRPQCNMTVTSSPIAFDLSPPQTTLYYVNYFYFLTFITAQAHLYIHIECCTKLIYEGKKCKQ